MPIKFPCPHCKKMLSVKDHLAGKKGPCPTCKKILTVPLESSSTVHQPIPEPAPSNGTSKSPEAKPSDKLPDAELPPEDAEAAAAAALADEQRVEETVEPTFIDFNCPQCDEPLHLSADLAGKRAPCPECKRIIKVPEIKKVEKADWRKTNAQGLPTGARRPDEPAPEGAWGNTTTSRNVSREALEEAAVLPDRYNQPLTVQQKVIRGLIIAAVAGSFFTLVAVGIGWWMSSRQAQSLRTVEDYANSPAATTKIGREGVAALHIAIGEYHLRNNKPNAAKDAQTEFNKALETLNTPKEPAVDVSERDVILADLALLQTDLGGSKDEIDKTTRLKWDEAQKAIRTTLSTMTNSEARLDAYRAVCRRLIAKNEVKHAVALASQLSENAADKAEALAIVALELFAANQKPAAEDAARGALAPYDLKEGRPKLMPSVVALAVVLNRDPLPKPNLEGSFASQEEASCAIGEAEGLARKSPGKMEAAREKANAIDSADPETRLRAYLALAYAGEAKSDNPDLLEAIKLATGDLNQKPKLGWLQLRLTELAAQAGLGDDQLNNLADAIKDRDLSARARLIILRQKLAGKNAGAPGPLPAEPPTLSHYLSVETLARHKRATDSGNTEEADRAFGQIGMMIGAVSK